MVFFLSDTISSFGHYLYNVVFDDDASALDLLALVGFLAAFWAAFFALGGATLKRIVHGRPWLIAAGERDYDRGGKELYEALGIPKTKKDFVDLYMDLWPYNQVMAVQHVVGGALCLPAILLMSSSTTAARLACLGILSEMGWEIEDAVTWIGKRLFLPDGKAKVPDALLFLMIIHHSMTTILGLPMVLRYGDLRALHWICFDLQAAAGVALIVTEYTKLLDITKPRQLLQFQALSGLALVVMIWTRGIHWVYLCQELIRTWYRDGAWTFLVLGSVLRIAFSFFNYVFCIQPFYKRFVKFLRASAEYQKLPRGAEPKRRRMAVMELEAAAAAMVVRNEMEQDLLSMFVTRKVKRRETVPASMFTSSRRQSAVLLRSSLGDVSHLLSKLDYCAEE